MNETSSQFLKNFTSGKSIFLYTLIASFLLNPAIALFIGLAFAEVNWWKLNLRNKVLPYLVVGLLVGLLANWTTAAHIRYDNFISLAASFVGIVIAVVFALHLWKQMDRDVISFRATQNNLAEPPRWKWAHYFFSLLIMLYVIVFGFGALTSLFGYCWYPTLPDIVSNAYDENRKGLDTVVMRVDDYGCGVNFWFQESGEPDALFTSATAEDGFSRTIFFRYFNKKQFTYQNSDIDHYVWIETNPQEFERIEQIPDRYDNGLEKFLELPVAELMPEPDLMRVTCFLYDDDENIDCSVTIVRGDIISVLDFDSANLPPDEFWRIFNSVIINTDKRIQEYQSQ